MKLINVKYELFDHDVLELDENFDREFHEIDREIELTFSHNEIRYLSWVQCKTGFFVGINNKSFFDKRSEHIREMTDHPFWEPLINQDVIIEVRGGYGELCRVSTPSHFVNICCFQNGNWGVDVLHISQSVPPPEF